MVDEEGDRTCSLIAGVFDNVWLIDIEGDVPQYSTSHYGVDVNTAVRQFQGDFELPEEISTDVKAFYEAMDREDYKVAKQLLDIIMEAVFDDEEMLAPIREDCARRYRD